MVEEYINSLKIPPNETPNVFYVVLASCDRYGIPEFPTSYFDGATKQSFKNHHIQVITVYDLLNDFKRACPNWDGESDLFPRSNETDYEREKHLNRIFENGCKLFSGTCDTKTHMDKFEEFREMMEQNGINPLTAYQDALRRERNLKLEEYRPDIYILLFSFIKRHKKDQIFVDELSILHSKSSKLEVQYVLRFIND